MTQPALTDEQFTQANGIIAGAATEVLNGNAIEDADRIKATRLYGVLLKAVSDNGTITDEDVVRNNATLMLAGGASLGDVIKYLVDCMTGNPIAAPAALVDDDSDLLADLGGTVEDTAPAAAPKPTPPKKTTPAKAAPVKNAKR
jgi:cytochrome P450